jgi:DNA repair/transcription protein MET18/MMS19
VSFIKLTVPVSFCAFTVVKYLEETENKFMHCRLVLYRAFGHIISNAPVSAVITEAHQVYYLSIRACTAFVGSEHTNWPIVSFSLQILLLIVDILAKLSVDIQDKDLVYSLLLVLSGMLMDDKGDNIYFTLLFL